MLRYIRFFSFLPSLITRNGLWQAQNIVMILFYLCQQFSVSFSALYFYCHASIIFMVGHLYF